MELSPLPETFGPTRDALQRVAAHVLARRRFTQVGKLGLRATPDGFGTPAFGPHHEVVRTSGTRLVRETTGVHAVTTSLDLVTATLADAADLVGVDLDADFSAGHDTPPLGDRAAPLAIDPIAASTLAGWYRFGWRVLDATMAALGPAAEPSVVQLWPEHFDAGCDVGVGAAQRANLGASPGDASLDQPYVYAGPWGPERPGDPRYWNAPFGAMLPYEELRSVEDPVSEATRFLLRGIELLHA